MIPTRAKGFFSAYLLLAFTYFPHSAWSAEQDVAWTELVNVTATGNDVYKSGGCDSCADAGAISEQSLSQGDGYVQFIVDDSVGLMFAGLNSDNPGTTGSEIDFAIRVQSGIAEVRESGSYIAETGVAAGDVFKIAIEGGHVVYYKNGQSFRTTQNASLGYPLKLDTAFLNSGTGISDAVITSDDAVFWTNVVNAITLGSTIVKSGGCDGCEDAGGSSLQTISSGDGYVEFTIPDAAPMLFAGLGHGDSQLDAGLIDFAIRTQSGSAEVRENGTYIIDTPFVSGDVFRIAIEQGLVKYYHNGQNFYTSGVAPSYPLQFDVVLFGAQAEVANASISSGASSGEFWTDLVNVTAAGTSLQKTSGCDGCSDAGAVSQSTVASGDGYVEFTIGDANKVLYAGLSSGNPGTSASEIDFSIRVQLGNAEVRESGNYRTEVQVANGDVFRIAVESGFVKYYKNGAWFYTSSGTPSYPFLLDTTLQNLDAALSNAAIVAGSGNGGGGDTTAPAAPSISLLASSDTGSSDTDAKTSDSTPTIRAALNGTGGTAPVEGDVVSLYEGSAQVGSATLTSSDILADYVDITSSALGKGSLSFTATVTDGSSNTSGASNALAVTLDTTVPVVASGTVTDASLVLHYTETGTGLANVTPPAGDYSVTKGSANDPVSVTGVTVSTSAQTVTLTLGAAVAAGENVQVSYTPGATTGTDKLQDVAGNEAAALNAYSVTNNTGGDGTAPAAPTISLTVSSDTGSNTTDGKTNDSTPTIQVSFNGTGDTAPVGGDVARLYEGTTEVGSATLTASDITAGYVEITSSALSEGDLSFTATITDGSNNTSAASNALAVTLDTTAPVFANASVNESLLVLNYTESGVGLDGTTPLETDYTVTKGTSNTEVSVADVVVDTATARVNLTLSSAITETDSNILVSYAPLDNRLQDIAGNEAAALNGEAVTNNTGGGAEGGIIDTYPYQGRARVLPSTTIPKGKFTFPAPWNTTGYRITDATDRNTYGDGDESLWIGYSMWPRINNHASLPYLLIYVPLTRWSNPGANPDGHRIYYLHKSTGETGLFGTGATAGLSNRTDGYPFIMGGGGAANYHGEINFWHPTEPFSLVAQNGDTLEKWDVRTQTRTEIIDLSDYGISGSISGHIYFSADGSRVSMLISNDNTVVYDIGSGNPPKVFGSYYGISVDESKMDHSGNYLIVKELPDPAVKVDPDEQHYNVIWDIDSETVWTVLPDRWGAGGHSDRGWNGYVSLDNWTASAVRYIDITTQPDGQGDTTLVYDYSGNWVSGPLHVSWINAKPGDVTNQFWVGNRASSNTTSDYPHVNEIIAGTLDGSKRVLSIAPTFTDMSQGTVSSYYKSPHANVDYTGRYVYWASNLGTGALDVIIAEIPYEKLVGN